MILHTALGETPFRRFRQLKKMIDQEEIRLAGNIKLKIYGKLTCSPGKRIKLQNRIFFKDEAEAIDAGYRPCGHCMRNEYKKWKGK
jgi:methylphosphotriester-DNA--protein-cysteine methyltransferase